MLEIKKEVKKVKIDDVVYDARRPTLLEVREFRTKALSEGGDADIELLDLLEKCNIDRVALETLDVDSINAISSLLMPKKKK